jgi:hypothetical protein
LGASGGAVIASSLSPSIAAWLSSSVGGGLDGGLSAMLAGWVASRVAVRSAGRFDQPLVAGVLPVSLTHATFGNNRTVSATHATFGNKLENARDCWTQRPYVTCD